MSINEYTHFGGSDYDIRSMLELVGDFFEKQNQKDKINPDIIGTGGDKVKYHQPFKDQIASGDKSKASDAVKLMRRYHGQLQKQVNEMEQQVRDLESQIKAAFGVPEMQKQRYHLHAICVHDGNATSGHYYSFIYDRCQKKWRKYNDIKVTEVSEEDVFRASEGGDSWQTAYWLVYVAAPIAGEQEKTDLNFYKVPADPFVLGDFSKHFYGSKVPAEVNAVVEKENQALAKEIDDQRNQKILTELKSIYNLRYGEMKSEFSSAYGQNAHLKCFPAYLWARSEVESFKKIILAEAYHDVMAEKDSPYPKDIHLLDPQTTLYKAILEGTRGSPDYPSALALN